MKCANPRENVVQVHPRLRDFDLIRRRDLAFGRRLETCGRLPEEPRPCTRPRMRSLECCFGNVPPRPEWVQSHFRVQVERGIIGTKSQIPAMQLAKLGVHLQEPIVAFRVGMHCQSEISTHAEIIAAHQTKHVRKRSITPRQVENRGTQT